VAWCENGFNLVRAASALHVHRNTLVYRLAKIAELTGCEVRDHAAGLSLYLACLADELEACSSAASPGALPTG
jgi:carbohydrate diacid regulator